VGTPFGITVDSQTLQDQTVTLRERDSMEQVRVKIDELVPLLNKKIRGI
jgi:glycyl-tRNA synthetase